MKKHSLKTITINFLKVSKYIVILYYMLHSSFLISVHTNLNYNNSLKLNTIQVIIYIISFGMLVFLSLIVDYYNKVEKKLKKLVITEFIANILWFLISFLSLKNKFLSFQLTIIVIVVIGVILITANIFVVKKMIKYYDKLTNQEIHKIFFNDAKVDSNFSLEEQEQQRKYLERQKVKIFIIIIILTNKYVYSNKWILLAFIIFIFGIILFIVYKKSKTNIVVKPSILLILTMFLLFTFTYILYLSSTNIKCINKRDFRFVFALIPLILLIFYQNKSRNYYAKMYENDDE